jgi:hypothetical protein
MSASSDLKAIGLILFLCLVAMIAIQIGVRLGV